MAGLDWLGKCRGLWWLRDVLAIAGLQASTCTCDLLHTFHQVFLSSHNHLVCGTEQTSQAVQCKPEQARSHIRLPSPAAQQHMHHILSAEQAGSRHASATPACSNRAALVFVGNRQTCRPAWLPPYLPPKPSSRPHGEQSAPG